jgi:glycerophosphoryl diester phosphodiesterase
MAGLEWLTAQPIAHRGLHDSTIGIVENTPSAVEAALSAGYGIEVDLQVTADGDAVVHHDEVLGRLTDGRSRLDALTVAELKRVPFHDTTDRMLTLGELCDLVGGRAALLLELKSRFDWNHRLAIRAYAVLDGYRGPAAVMSFDPYLIMWISKVAPNLVRGIVAEKRVPRGVQWMGRVNYVRSITTARPRFVAYAVDDLPAVAPLLARYVLGLPLLTWTVRDERQRQLAKRWADQMIFEGFRP